MLYFMFIFVFICICYVIFYLFICNVIFILTTIKYEVVSNFQVKIIDVSWPTLG